MTYECCFEETWKKIEIFAAELAQNVLLQPLEKKPMTSEQYATFYSTVFALCATTRVQNVPNDFKTVHDAMYFKLDELLLQFFTKHVVMLEKQSIRWISHEQCAILFEKYKTWIFKVFTYLLRFWKRVCK